MSIRAGLLGLLLGLAISLATYFNDFVVGQSSLINHLLPIGVLGFLLGLILVVNPAIGAARAAWRLRPAEIALVGLIGLTACTWPGAGFFRTALTNIAMPAHLLRTEPSWRQAEIMSYVPGGSPRIAPGHMTDPHALAEALHPGADAQDASIASRLWSALSEEARRAAIAITRSDLPSTEDRNALRSGLNELIMDGVLAEPKLSPPERSAQTRRRIVAAFPEAIAPMPEGRQLLVGDVDRPALDVHDALLTGTSSGGLSLFTQINWSAWRSPLVFWGLLAVLMGLASLCLALIVHPQWSRRELLPYPIARFINEMIRPGEGGLLPRIATQKLFWGAFVAVMALHLFNGLGSWFPAVPAIPRSLNMQPLATLFPQMSKIGGFTEFLRGNMFLTVIAFAFFLERGVSLSLGLSSLAFAAFAAAFVAAGVQIDSQYLADGRSNMLRFGAYLGAAFLIAYNGRHYYLTLTRAALTGAQPGPVPRYSIWAGRVLILLLVAMVVWLTGAGYDWWLAAAAVLLALLMFLVIGRIVAETGMFFIQPYWMPVAVLTAFFGFEAIGPTAYLCLALFSTMIVGDTRTALIGNLLNGFQVVDKASSDAAGAGSRASAAARARPGDRTSPAPASLGPARSPLGRATPWLITMLIVGFLVAGLATMYVQHRHSVTNTDAFTQTMLPSMPFDQALGLVGEAASRGNLTAAVEREGLDALRAVKWNSQALLWTGMGLAFFVACSIARLRLTWWSIHPVLFLVWGTFPGSRFAFSFFAGWLIKVMVTSFGGLRAYQATIPLMVGVIAAEVTAGLFWVLVGAVYYFSAGLRPPSYSIF